MKRTRTHVEILGALILVGMLQAPSCSRSVSGTFPYDAELVEAKGAPFTLAPMRGEPMIVVTYVASMPDCQERIQRFVALSKEVQWSEVRFVAIDIGFRNEDHFPDVLPKERGKVLFLSDRGQEVRKSLAIDITPTTFLVLPGGKIQDRIEGYHSWDSAGFRSRVAAFASSIPS